jgi:hypothetical protein
MQKGHFGKASYKEVNMRKRLLTFISLLTAILFYAGWLKIQKSDQEHVYETMQKTNVPIYKDFCDLRTFSTDNPKSQGFEYSISTKGLIASDVINYYKAEASQKGWQLVKMPRRNILRYIRRDQPSDTFSVLISDEYVNDDKKIVCVFIVVSS